MTSANFPDCPLTSLFRRLKSTKALRGIPLAAGAVKLPEVKGPGRIVLWPAEGDTDEPSDASVSIGDVNQRVVVELWGYGSNSGADEERQLAAWNAVWALLVAFNQALAEQGESPSNIESPGLAWKVEAGPTWSTEVDTTRQGATGRLVVSAVCPIPAASDDTGHVGDNWPEGGPVVDVNFNVTRS